jgi:tripeptide aminopeptidase
VERDLPHAGAEFVFTVAEEIGCKGATALQLDALEGPVGFVYDYVGNVGTYVASAPAGYLLSCDVTGRAAHAGLAPEDGRSAVDAAARAIASLRTGRLPAGETVNVGLVRGGSAHNVVAEHCSFVVDVRAPTQDVAAERVAEIVEACERAVSTNGCTLDVRRDEKYRAYGFDGGEPVLELALRALQACGHEPHGVVSGGGADANIFNASGRPCVNLANGMADVHTASEWIAVEALEQMVDVTLAVLEQARD